MFQIWNNIMMEKKAEYTEYLAFFVAKLYFSKVSLFFISIDSAFCVSYTEPANSMTKLLYLLKSHFRSMYLGAGLPKQASSLVLQCLRITFVILRLLSTQAKLFSTQ